MIETELFCNDINIYSRSIPKNVKKKFLIDVFNLFQHSIHCNDDDCVKCDSFYIKENLNCKYIKSNLKTGGYLIIGTPLVGTFIANFFGKNYRLYSKSHITLFNLKNLKDILESDFNIVKIEKPFLKTKYNSFRNFLRLFNNKKLSPPFYGSIVTLYAQKK